MATNRSHFVIIYTKVSLLFLNKKKKIGKIHLNRICNSFFKFKKIFSIFATRQRFKEIIGMHPFPESRLRSVTAYKCRLGARPI